MKKSFSLLVATILIAFLSEAQLRLPAIISSGMVLQQNDSAAIWGWANPGEKIFVTTGWNDRTDSAITTNRASWKVKVKTPAAGGPYTITFKGSVTIKLENILIGEVWVCSGQSNMEWSYMNGLKDVKDELPACYNSDIRFFHIPKTTAEYPQDDVKAQWKVCDSNSLKIFSAIGYFFGKKLNKELNVPIGLINSSWGGTPAEVWTANEVLNNNEDLKLAAAKLQSFRWWPNHAGLCYNAMIAPITNYAIAGSIWYQGESNVNNNSTYQKLFTSMISAWRRAWNKEFPFYYVQIAPYKYGFHNVGALLQEAQTRSMSFPETGMVVVTDIIDSVTNIHPSNKHDVGYRLANWALAETYKQKGIIYKSPMYKSKEIKKNKVTLSFENTPKGFVSSNGIVSGFFISGTKEEWFPAESKIEKDKIVVWSDKVPVPLHVRYGFGNIIVGNIISKEGLPLCPFRTDNWPVDQSQVK